MSPKLKPLMLPQLVEEMRRKLEIQHNFFEDDEQHEEPFAYDEHNISSSDLVSISPTTPIFSRSGHSRCSGSVSSLDMCPSSCSESPASPYTAQSTHANNTPAQKNSSSSPLPDLQEDPLEREEEEGDVTVLPDHFAFRDCFCDAEHPLSSSDEALYLAHSAINPYAGCHSAEFDYDLGFLSETDLDCPRQKCKRDGSVSSFWSTRLGSRLPTLTRWKSTTRKNSSSLPFSPASDPSLAEAHPGRASRAASSRSSSISAQGRRNPYDRAHEPPLPETPALSLFESRESIDDFPDAEILGSRASLERERSMATTPLLPPMLTENLKNIALSRTTSLQPSPLQSPAVLASPNLETYSMQSSYPTPPLSTKVSVSSFRQQQQQQLPSPIPPFLDQDGDAWSDRLGHANYTILPKPYSPETADVPALVAFREAWDLARVNYTKHLMRTGEHYGTTSKTYTLTQAKWAETEGEWLARENELVERLTATDGCASTRAMLEELRGRKSMSGEMQVPRIDGGAQGKFPERGDVDIVGPMVRDKVMVRGDDAEKKGGAWFRGLAERMGLRR